MTGQFEIQKTLSAELVPWGSTDVSNLKDLIQKDFERYSYRKEVMEMIDNRHKKLLSRIKYAPLKFRELEILLRKFNSTKKDKDVKKSLEKLQKLMCSELIEWIESENKEEFELLTAATPSKIVKELIRENPDNKHISVFKNFCSYLTEYSTARKNIYSKDNKANSVAHRLITENFPRFIDNKTAFEKLSAEFPEIISDVRRSLPQLGESISRFGLTEHYMEFSDQNGITYYNAIAGEINKAINFHIQANPDDKKALKRLRMKSLYKQILFDAESMFVKFERIYDSDELGRLIGTLWTETLSYGSVLDEMKKLLFGIDKCDKNGIFIKKNAVSRISKYLHNEPNVIMNSIKDKFGKSVMKNRDCFALSEIISDETEFREFFSELEKHYSVALISFAEINSSSDLMSERTIGHIREFMGSLNDFRKLSDIIAISEDPQADTSFYNKYEELYENTSVIKKAFNVVKTFVCQRPKDISQKFSLTFGFPTFMGGWDFDKINSNIYGAAMFAKDNRIFIGVMNKNSRVDLTNIRKASDGEDVYRLVVYKQLGSAEKQLPKMFDANAPADIKKLIADKKNKQSFDEGKLIDYYKKCLRRKYSETFNLNFSETSEYKSFQDFMDEVNRLTYKISFKDVPVSQLEEWVDSGKMFMFSVHTKDYAPGAYGSKELFTIFLESLFSEENLNHNVIRLNGNSKIIMRPQTLKKTPVHKNGSILLNKRDNDGNPIPDDIYVKLFRFLNGMIEKSELSKKEEEYIDRVKYKKAEYDIIKDRRYTQDKLIINLTVSINPGCESSYIDFNREVREHFMSSEDAHIIGIDRGERNILYVWVMDKNRNVVLDKSLNVMEGYDYHMKLEQLEKQRRESQRNWETVEKIKHLKDGFVAKAVYEICRLMIEYNAIVVMESLNQKFTTSRSAAFGPAVYAQFQRALLNKLSYMVLKEKKPLEKGGILNGYQLAYVPKSITDNPVQFGKVFFVPAGYTSKVDPVTGFANLFDFGEYETSGKSAAKFTDSCDSIRVNADGDVEIDFDYGNFKTHIKRNDCRYTCVLKGKRILSKKNPETGYWEYADVDVHDEMRKFFEKYGIDCVNGMDVKSELMKARKKEPLIDKDFIGIVKTAMRMRNSNPNTGEDYIISPVVNVCGKTFDSRDVKNIEEGLPVNGDSNGARNIALKGFIMISEEKKTGTFKTIKNEEWFDKIPKFLEMKK